MNNHDLVRAHLLNDTAYQNQPIHCTYEQLRESEWSNDFEEKMRTRLMMGAFRYGRMGVPGKPQYDRVADMQNRLKKYAEDGNLEHLVDVSNLAMLEYVEGVHPKRHFESKSDGEHTDVQEI